MAEIAINLDDTPIEIPQLTPGDKLLQITNIEDKEEEQKGKTENLTVVEFQVNDDADVDHGRKTWERFNFRHEVARTKFKQMCVAAGLPGGGQSVDTSDLIGKTLKAEVKQRTYKDKNGETKVAVNINKFHYKPEGS